MKGQITEWDEGVTEAKLVMMRYSVAKGNNLSLTARILPQHIESLEPELRLQFLKGFLPQSQSHQFIRLTVLRTDPDNLMHKGGNV